MATGLPVQWRKFNFFDVKTNIDEGNLSETLKDSNITCTSSGRGIIFIGDSNGWVHSLNRQLQISSFQAHEQPVHIIQAFDNSNLLLTVQGNTSGPSEVKIWCPERQNLLGVPSCLRVLRPDPHPSHARSHSPSTSRSRDCPLVTAISLHPNNALLAVGFTDGAILLYRGDVKRERGCKARVIVTFQSGAITNLHLKATQKTCHLFATTKHRVYCINCSTKDKETTVELDKSGCSPGCSALADSKHEHELLVAKTDAIYTYTTDSKASCYIFEGQKVSLSWFRGYLIVVAAEGGAPKHSAPASPTVLTVYDPLNKLVSLSTVVEGFVDVVGEWGGLYVVVRGPALLHLQEKDLQSKLELLFKKNQFDVAINLAKVQCCDPEDVAEIVKAYGDWLYAKGNTLAAMTQYIKTIPHLEASYVIKKFLDTHHIDNLTTYLQALHKSGHATTDHTTLLLNCYTRLRDEEHLDHFIKEGAMECDVALGIKVCRGAGYVDHALALASKHCLHAQYMDILMEDKKDYEQALSYIWTLEFESAVESILVHGAALLNHAPDRVTDLLVALCTDYTPIREPRLIVEEHRPSSPAPPSSPPRPPCEPESFEYLLLGQSEASISFLERVMARRPLSKHLNTTLLAELLHQFSLAPEGQDQSLIEEKTLKLLRGATTCGVSFDRDHALLLCDKHEFHAGKTVLWEQAGMFEDLLSFYASRGAYGSVVDVCRRHADDVPQLWANALRLITAKNSQFPPEAHLLNDVMNKIDELELVPSLEVVDLLTSCPYVSLGQVRGYLLRVVASHTSSFAQEEALAQSHRAETAALREAIDAVTTDTVEFTSKKCNVCNNNLELPSVHFLCRHSFHVHCFQSYSENESECPICFPENKKLQDSIAAQKRSASRADVLQEQLDKSSDCFSVVADFVARGIFSDATQVAALHPSPNATKMPDSECSLRALERTSQGPAGVKSEARLRLSESCRGGGGAVAVPGAVDPPSEGRLRQRAAASSFPAAVAEGRARKTPTPSPSPSLNPFSSPSSPHPPPPPSSEGPPLSISASLSNASPSLRRTTPTLQQQQQQHRKTENPFEEEDGGESPQGGVGVGGDFATEEEEDALNPFAEGYEGSKVPSFVKGNNSAKGDTSSNPFHEYDPSLNPFGE